MKTLSNPYQKLAVAILNAHTVIGRSKEEQKAYYRRWYEKYGRNQDKTKLRAHGLVRLALKKGVLVRPQVCSDCQERVRVEGHHPDYSKPLEVLWLCPTCHNKLHPKGTPTPSR